MTLDIIVETTILVAFLAIILLYFYHLKPHGVAVVLLTLYHIRDVQCRPPTQSLPNNKTPRFNGMSNFLAALVCILIISAARFGGIPQIWCIQRANCEEIFNSVELYFWWNFWGI